MKALWTGSDTIYATQYPKHGKKSKWMYMFAYKIFVRIMDVFVEGHYFVADHLVTDDLRKKLKSPILGVLVDPPKYPLELKKKEHKGFNVLYYCPKGRNQKFINWVYGWDIYEKAKKILDVNFIHVDGKQDMNEIYPIVDFYLRPNRSDGRPRIIMECVINNIPYYHTIKNPDINEVVKKIRQERSIQSDNADRS